MWRSWEAYSSIRYRLRRRLSASMRQMPTETVSCFPRRDPSGPIGPAALFAKRVRYCWGRAGFSVLGNDGCGGWGCAAFLAWGACLLALFDCSKSVAGLRHMGFWLALLLDAGRWMLMLDGCWTSCLIALPLYNHTLPRGTGV